MFGANATVFLKYDGDIKELAEELSAKMQIPEIWFDSDMDPPHEIFGMSNFCGFELWLYESTEIEKFNFKISFETSMDVKDRFNYDLVDLSQWFAKELFRRCKIETIV